MRILHSLNVACLGVAFVSGADPWLARAQETGKQKAAKDSSPVTVIERNKSVIRDFHNQMDKGNVEAALSNFADEAENHGRKVNKQIFRLILEDIGRTFPDSRDEIVEIVAEGDTVVTRTKVSGTHKGTGKLPVNGGLLVGVPPTGKHYEVQHIHWFKLRDGKIIAHWANRDDVGMMQQLGLLPTPTSRIAEPTGCQMNQLRQRLPLFGAALIDWLVRRWVGV